MKPSEQLAAAVAEVDRALEELPEGARQSLEVEGLGFKELHARLQPIIETGPGGRRQFRRARRIVRTWRDEWMAEIARVTGGVDS